MNTGTGYDDLLRTREMLSADALGFRQASADHLLYRRFGAASAANLELAHARLADADAKARRFVADVVLGRTLVRAEKAAATEALHDELHGALKRFDEACQIQERLMAAQSPASHLYARILDEGGDLVRGHCAAEGAHRAGMFLLGATDKGPIHRFLDSKKSLRRLYVKDEESQVAGFETYSEAAVRLTENVIVSLMFITLVLLPVFLLLFIQSKVRKMAVVLGFVVLVSAVITFVANGMQRVNLGAMAAYTAVLVVFLGSNIN